MGFRSGCPNQHQKSTFEKLGGNRPEIAYFALFTCRIRQIPWNAVETCQNVKIFQRSPYFQSQKKAEAFGRKEESYPPHGLSEGVKKLPQWIQLGCGNSEYVCKEKGATFTAENQPDQLPDLSKHNSFFADTMRNNPGLWDQYKDKQTSLGVTFAHCIKTGVDNKGKKLN